MLISESIKVDFNQVCTAIAFKWSGFSPYEGFGISFKYATMSEWPFSLAMSTADLPCPFEMCIFLMYN